MKLKIAIIGLGKIGAQYPNIIDNSYKNITYRNHLDAVLSLKETEIAALVEPDVSVQNTIKNKYPNIPHSTYYKNISLIPTDLAYIYILCTPTSLHFKNTMEILDKNIKILLIEKPLCLNSLEAKEIIKKAKLKNIELYINFNRRYDPHFLKIKNKYTTLPKNILFRYSKGLYNYGSHFIDFVIDWFGEIKEVRANDFIKLSNKIKDPNINFTMKTKSGIICNAVTLNDLNYDQFEIDIFYNNYKITFRNGGTEKYIMHKKNHLYYPSYTQLLMPNNLEEPNPIGNLRIFYDMVIDKYKKGTIINCCNYIDGLHGIIVIEAIINSSQNNNCVNKI